MEAKLREDIITRQNFASGTSRRHSLQNGGAKRNFMKALPFNSEIVELREDIPF